VWSDAGQRGDAPIVIDVVVARDVMHGPRAQRGALLVRVMVMVMVRVRVRVRG
jgi:hypothetical protein